MYFVKDGHNQTFKGVYVRDADAIRSFVLVGVAKTGTVFTHKFHDSDDAVASGWKKKGPKKQKNPNPWKLRKPRKKK